MSPVRRFLVGEALPLTLTREELAGLLQKSLSRFDELRKLGTHPAIKEILPRDGHPLFCGTTAQAWIDGHAGQAEERTRRFFRKAKRTA